MKYEKARELIAEAIEQLGEEEKKPTKKQIAAHNAKFAKIRAKNQKYLEQNKKRAAAEGGVGGILHKFRGFLGSPKSK